MTSTIKSMLAAGLAVASLSAPAFTAPAMAQAAQKVAVVNIPAVMANSSAYQTAQTQRQTTYAAQLQQAETRRQAIQAQLDPMIAAFQTAAQASNADQNALQQQAAQIQAIQQQGQAELQQIMQPVALSEAYVTEQIQDQLGTALERAAQAAGVTMVIGPDTILWADAGHNLNEAVLAQLNTLIPSAQLVPPTGWLPREMREQQAAAQAAAAAQPQPAASGR